MRILSNLNLDADSSIRARPNIGEWGPAGVPTTKAKKWARVLAWVAFVVALVAVVLAGAYFYHALTGA